MKDLMNRVLLAYRPLYLRGLLMDGQYRSPAPQENLPPKGKKRIHLTPALQPGRRRVLIATAVGMILSANEDIPAKPLDEPDARVRK
jgi:hypothetical protein